MVSQSKDNCLKKKRVRIEKEMIKDHKYKRLNKVVDKAWKNKKEPKWEKRGINKTIKMEERVNKFNIILRVEIQKNSNQVAQWKCWWKITK